MGDGKRSKAIIRSNDWYCVGIFYVKGRVEGRRRVESDVNVRNRRWLLILIVIAVRMMTSSAVTVTVIVIVTQMGGG